METGIRVHFKVQNGGEHDAIGATVVRHEGNVLILESDEAEELRFYEAAPGDWRMLHEQGMPGHWQAHETGPTLSDHLKRYGFLDLVHAQRYDNSQPLFLWLERGIFSVYNFLC